MTKDRAAVIEIAQMVQRMRAGLASHADLVRLAIEVAHLVPIRCCVGCGSEYLYHDRRKAKFCSDRCRSRIAQRRHRAKAKGLAA